MNRFVHGKMHHYLMDENDGDGNDLGGGDDATDDVDESDEHGAGDDQEEDGDEEVSVTIDGEEPAEEEEDLKTAPSWVKDLRKTNREDKRRIRELEEQLKKGESAPTQVPALGKEPELDDEDIDYDAVKFKAKLTAWYERKREIDNAESQKKQQADQQKVEWEGKLKAYGDAKTKLKVADFDDAESVVMSMFDQTQQGIIIDAMDNPAMVIYALGRNKKTAERLAAIKKPTQFLREMARLEDTKLKVQSKKSAPPPEKTVSGQGRITGAVDSTLEKLREEAAKTGDSSKVIAYKRDQKRKQKS